MKSYERMSGGLVGSIPQPTKHVEKQQVSSTAEMFAALTIQSAFRGFLARKEVILGLHRENVGLKEVVKEKDITIASMNEQLVYQKDMLERLSGELDTYKFGSCHPTPSGAKGNVFVRSMSTDTNNGFQSDSTLFGYGGNDQEIMVTKESKERLLDNIYAAFSHEMTAAQDLPIAAIAKAAEGTLASSPSSLVGGQASSSNIWGPVGTSLSFADEPAHAAVTMNEPFRGSMSEQVKSIWASPTFQMSMPNTSHMYGKKSFGPIPDMGYMSHPTIVGIKPNFKSMIDKIIRANDQPSSIYLQQRLRSETSQEVRNAIFEAISHQAVPLMKNRFGNFLVQCCFEACVQPQVQLLVSKMQGHVMVLSCDRFGCHVMQKALDCLSDDLRITIISELIRYVHETLTHRFACHVWQRVFEIKWTTCDPTAVMTCIFNTLRGQWGAVANDENGSLVVQCIFENCSETEKSGIVTELFDRTLDIAQGQWGNWVMQHLLEHGQPAERAHITKIVTDNVLMMSLDQYASKVVERCLKICSKKEIHSIVNKLIATTTENGGPTALLQMMNHQYGNYVVQNVLSVADAQQRDACLRVLVPNMNLLKNSKYGQRVATLCEKYLRVPHAKFGQLPMHPHVLHPLRQEQSMMMHNSSY